MADIKNQAENLRDKAGEAASNTAEKTKQGASSMMEKGQDFARNVADKVGETARSVGDKAGKATENLGGRMKSAAQNIRERGPQSGFLHSASESLADGMESTGEYLEEKGLSGMAGDVTDLIRRNPLPALLIAVGIGFLIARSFRS